MASGEWRAANGERRMANGDQPEEDRSQAPRFWLIVARCSLLAARRSPRV
ncbi:MAG: hypothetical protein AB7G76_14080 [Steroidobacteraceae bacterium]